MPDGPGTIDFAQSRAILVGTGTYTHSFGTEPMPAAANSVAAMRTALTRWCSWPSDRITVLVDQSTHDGVPGRIADLVHETEDVLVFYYVGHGQLLIGNDLGLALTDTSEDHRKRLSTSLKLSELHRELEYNCDARIKILILDCCLSGIATKYAQGPDDLADRVHQSAVPAGNGTYVWTACGHSQETYFEPGPTGLTYFTRLLTTTLHQGIEGAGRYLTIADLHQEVTRGLRQTVIPGADIAPEPTLRFTGSTDRFRLAPNRAQDLDQGRYPSAASFEQVGWDARGEDSARWAVDPQGGGRTIQHFNTPQRAEALLVSAAAVASSIQQPAASARVNPRASGAVTIFFTTFFLVSAVITGSVFLIDHALANTSIGLTGPIRFGPHLLYSHGHLMLNPVIAVISGFVSGSGIGLGLSPFFGLHSREIQSRVVLADLAVCCALTLSAILGGALRLGLLGILAGVPPLVGIVAILSGLWAIDGFEPFPIGNPVSSVIDHAEGALGIGAIGGVLGVGIGIAVGTDTGLYLGLGVLTGIAAWMTAVTGFSNRR